ncbi:MAG: hypothetical protein KKD47_07055 [Proteobacteria bacterium]|nr:hypothetical protein [Pseudomonadota bacterium]
MKKLSIFIVTLMVIVFLAAVESQAGRVEKRHSRQQDRIDAGIAKGGITSREARILRNEQDNIDEQRERALRDRHLSKRERIRLERRQDLANRHIYSYKHNGIERRDRHHYDYDDISFKRSTVLVPLILPPLPPLPLVFPGMHIIFHSSR